MMDRYEIFMEAISQLDLTPAQLEATGNLARNIGMGSTIKEVNDIMNEYTDYVRSQPHTKDEFFDKVNKKWRELRDRYKLKVPEDNWFEVDLKTLLWRPTYKDYSSESEYSDEEKRYDADAQAKAWLNMMFDRHRKDRTDFRRFLQWERDCLRMKFMNRGAGIAAYANDKEIKQALTGGDIAELIGNYCFQKYMMHPFMVGIEAADNPATKRKYADLSNRMAYLEDVKFNGKIPSRYIDPSDVVWFGWHRMPNGERAFTKKRFGHFSDMFAKAPPKPKLEY